MNVINVHGEKVKILPVTFTFILWRKWHSLTKISTWRH